MKVTCQGVKATKQYLTVYLSYDYGKSIRFGSVKVPIAMLLADDVQVAVDSLVRARLLEAWEPDDALPGIG